jgi:hypothetical protein
MSAIQEEVLIKIAADVSSLKAGMSQASAEMQKGGQSAKQMESGMGALTERLKTLNVNFGGVGINVGHAATQLGKAKTAMQAATVSTRAFGMALAATGIGLIVVAIGTLIAAFKSTQEGTDRLNRVIVPLKSAMQALWGVIQNISLALSDKLVKAFRDPRQAIIDLGEAIKQNLINRVQGLLDGFAAVGRGIKALFKGDIEGAKQAAIDFGKATVQAVTGVTDALEKGRSAYAEFLNEFKRGTTAGKEIQRLQEAIEKAELKAIVRRAELNVLLREGERIATDTTLSDKERLAALEQARGAAREIVAIEQNILDLKAKQITAQNALNDTSREDERALKEKQAAIIEQNALLAQQERSFNRIGRSIKDSGDLIENMPEFEMIDLGFSDEEVDAISENFADIGAQYDLLAQKMNQTAAAAEMFAGMIAGTVGEAFEVLFDKTKGFEDFADAVQKSMQRLIRQLVEAAVKALVLSSILKTLPGFGAAMGGATSFGSLMSGGMGMNSGSFRIRGNDLLTLNNQSANNQFR